MNKIRAQLRAHKILTAVMGFSLIAGFAVVGVRAITMTPDELKEFLPQPPQEESLGAALTPCENHNGIEICSYAEGFNEATTTLFAIRNPYGATSTVDFLLLEGHTGSTAIDMYVGTSTKSSLPPNSTGSTIVNANMSSNLVNATAIATSSKFVIRSGQNAVYGSGQVAAGSKSLSEIIVGPSEYVIGYASSTDNGNVKDNSATTTTGGITGSGNTFFGNYGLRFVKSQTPQKN